MRLKILTDRLRDQAPTVRLLTAHRRLNRVEAALTRTGAQLFITRRARLAAATTRLEALSPLAVLKRGYALVYSENGMLLTSATDTAPGRQIRARLAAGTIEAGVIAVSEQPSS